MPLDCADCADYVCRTGRTDLVSDSCPMRDGQHELDGIPSQTEQRRLAEQAARVEAEGYCHWTRLREVIELSRRMGYRRIGIGACWDMVREAQLLRDHLHRAGFEVCLPSSKEPCDPTDQARQLTEAGVELVVLAGLCVGHDALLIRHLSVPVTSLVVRDLRLAHNPVAAMYLSQSYLQARLFREHRHEKRVESGGALDEGRIARVARAVAEEGRARNWCRIEEIIEFSWRLDLTRVGIAYCAGFRHEAHTLKRILTHNGLVVSSICCKTGSIPKERLGIADHEKVRPGQPEMICNSQTQATLLNNADVQLALLLGQCVGHDSVTIAHLEIPVVCVAAKDRVLGHNTAAALHM